MSSLVAFPFATTIPVTPPVVCASATGVVPASAHAAMSAMPHECVGARIAMNATLGKTDAARDRPHLRNGRGAGAAAGELLPRAWEKSPAFQSNAIGEVAVRRVRE